MAYVRTLFDTVDVAVISATGVIPGGITGIMCSSTGAATYKLVKDSVSGDATEYEITLLAGMVLDFPTCYGITLTESNGDPITAGKVYVQYAQLYK